MHPLQNRRAGAVRDGVIGTMILVICASHLAAAQSPEEPGPIAAEKLAVLERLAAEPQPTESAQEPDPESGSFEELAAKMLDAARTVTGSSFECYGTGGFGVEFKLSATPGSSHLGYVVDASSDRCQDMVLLEDLSTKRAGTVTVLAACSDLHKDFPSSGLRMGPQPWTSDSSDHWAYWVRQVVTTGKSNGSSFDQIQSAVWYITDRSGSYDSISLLRSAGYPRNGPSKNASSGPVDDDITDVVNGDCGYGLCGAGQVALMPLTLLGIVAMKGTRRRTWR